MERARLREKCAMPRYYFDIQDDLGSKDEDGLILPDLEAARSEAIKAARDLAAVQVKDGHLNLRHLIVVKDEDRQPLITVRFGEAVQVES